MTVADDRPGVIALPPLLFAAAVLLGALLQWAWPIALPAPAYARWIAASLIVACFALAGMARTSFTRAGTNVNPMLPATRLVESGPFRYTRNPMYVAMSIALAALGIVTRSGWLLVMLIPMLALIHWGVVLREERYLARKFGPAYEEYRKRVPRYLLI